MKTEYERRVQETMERVQARASIRTERYDRGPLADYMKDPKDALDIARNAEKRPLPEGLTANFHRYAEFLFAWRFGEPFQEIAGEFHLVHIANALLGGTPPHPAASPEAPQLVSEFKIFQTHPVGGTGTYSALRLTEDGQEPELWYFDIRQGPTRLHISYGDYLDTMLLTKGLYNWQYLFAEPDPNNYAMRVSIPRLRNGLDLLAREFPDDDQSDLRARLEERARAADKDR
ncbi:hypothetical protein [Streptomyces niveus]|uniref:hypothetical protein n=1 Tax=Streptomyces niveus TaxID=193462 RepID=UPI0034276D15